MTGRSCAGRPFAVEEKCPGYKVESWVNFDELSFRRFRGWLHELVTWASPAQLAELTRVTNIFTRPLKKI